MNYLLNFCIIILLYSCSSSMFEKQKDGAEIDYSFSFDYGSTDIDETAYSHNYTEYSNKRYAHGLDFHYRKGRYGITAEYLWYSGTIRNEDTSITEELNYKQRRGQIGFGRAFGIYGYDFSLRFYYIGYLNNKYTDSSFNSELSTNDDGTGYKVALVFPYNFPLILSYESIKYDNDQTETSVFAGISFSIPLFTVF